MLIFYFLSVFVVGAVLGSFLNVCIARLPMDKSIIWPSSHCGTCLRPVAWSDNVPLVSYWLLRGRCRRCGAVFSARYFMVELLTAVGFAVLFWLTVVENVNRIPFLGRGALVDGEFPWQGWWVFAHRASLFMLLMIVSACDLDSRTIPLSVTVTGTVIGLLFATLLPWPWPYPVEHVRPAAPPPLEWFGPVVPPLIVPGSGPFSPQGGPYREMQAMVPWPVWWPLPDALPPGSWLTGLATGLAGALAGSLVLRGIRVIFSAALGREALGLGDADLMMMAGSFVGWPVVLVAFFLAVFPALVLGLFRAVLFNDRSLPFGPSLAAGVLVTLCGWHWLSPNLEPIFYSLTVMGSLIVSCGLFMGIAGLGLRRFRDPAEGVAA